MKACCYCTCTADHPLGSWTCVHIIICKPTVWSININKITFLHYRDGSVYAIVELAFGSSVSDPLKPLRDEMNDGILGSYTVDRQLDVNPSTGMSNTTLSSSC